MCEVLKNAPILIAGRRGFSRKRARLPTLERAIRAEEEARVEAAASGLPPSLRLHGDRQILQVGVLREHGGRKRRYERRRRCR